MALRFFVGGTASWDATAGTKWALTSGGAGGQAVPGTNDDVFFDGASGANTVSIDAAASCKSLTCTGFTGTLTGASSLNVRGDITLATGMTFTYSGALTTSINSSNITSAGKTFAGTVSVTSAGIVWTLIDNFICTNTFTFSAGTLALGGFSFKVQSFVSTNSNTRVITPGSSTIELTGTGTNVWNTTNTTGLTFNPGTSTIKITDTGSSLKTFSFGGLTYNNLWIAGTGTGSYGINGSNTFNDFKDDNTSAHTIQFTAGTTQTVTTFTVNGQSTSQRISLISSVASSPFTLSKASGTVTVSNLSITDSTATGGAIWDASNGTNLNGGGNTGWLFPATGGQGSSLGRGGGVSRRRMGVKINT